LLEYSEKVIYNGSMRFSDKNETVKIW